MTTSWGSLICDGGELRGTLRGGEREPDSHLTRGAQGRGKGFRVQGRPRRVGNGFS